MRRRLRRISDYPLRDILVPLRGDPAAAGKARAEGEGEMIPRALTLVALLIGATAPASAQNKLSWGEGSAPCSDWTKEHKANSAVSMQMSSWLRGYVSGANVMQNFKGNIFAKTRAEMDLMARYIDQYCLEHPADSVVVATDKLVKELIAR